MQLSRKILFTVIAAVIVLVCIGIWVGLQFAPGANVGSSPYTAVYLTSGDIYFGNLSWFPRPHMTNVWYIQRSVNGSNQPELGMAQFKNAFWQPVDEIFLNPQQILFSANVRSDSPIAKLLQNPDQFRQSAADVPPVPAPTSSTRK